MLYRRLFPQLADKVWKKIDLNAEAALLGDDVSPMQFCNPILCKKFVDRTHEKYETDFSYGGYLEDRKVLWKGHYMKPGATVHVGVDYNVPAGTLIRMPKEGKLIMIEQDIDQVGGWGTRAIYDIGGFYVTFAHLSDVYQYIGIKAFPSNNIAKVGDYTNNGGWFPHLHVQVQKKYDPSLDGYHPYSEDLSSQFLDPEKVLCDL